MFEHKRIQELDDFFIEMNSRKEKCVYFYRINGWTEKIEAFLQHYYKVARTSGVIIDGKIPNPDEKNLTYYNEMMGMDFQMSVGFIDNSLKKWLPRMNNFQRQNVASALYDTLQKMQQQGKNLNMLKNAYIKYMCWLYYKFERILNKLGEPQIPKILYGGSISDNELKLISILSKAGCDVLLVQYQGDSNYLKLDPNSQLSSPYQMSQMTSFPEGFGIQYLHKAMEKRMTMERVYGKAPEVAACTNAWIQGEGFEDVLRDIPQRGQDTKFFYNCFCRISGVDDKVTYLNDLYQLKSQIEAKGRKVLVVEHTIPQPTTEEISSIPRNNYTNEQQLISDLVRHIQYPANQELQRLMSHAFIDMLDEESKEADSNLNRLMNKAMYLLCWLKRYQSALFSNWKMPAISCFFYLGGCQTKYEAMFVKFLARLPIDVVILTPDLSEKCCLEDQKLYEKRYEQSLDVAYFPKENGQIHMGTVAYHAETELNTLMYQDSGLYRNQQYNKANAITLKTMYEELFILWDKELKYRENFSIMNQVVNVPVLFAKVSGVKDGLVNKYWDAIRTLHTADTLMIEEAPYITGEEENPMKAYSAQFFKNGVLQRDKIKSNKHYPYSFLREDIQEHILDKLQLLIDQKIIKGTGENGTEYAIIATILNLNQTILRMIQKFDFTKNNPKVVYITTTEKIISLEDSILVAFLNLAGFDILFFVPTGYQSIEKFFNIRQMEEHQVGEYLYDLQIPKISKNTSGTSNAWYKKIFRRGE